MKKAQLHITNGDSLTERLAKIYVEGEIIVWREMLCEGPTTKIVGDNEFFKIRKDFLKNTYNIARKNYEEKFILEIQKLQEAKGYDEIVLWFEFDLFCHINMLAAIAFYVQNNLKVPLYLVCSKRLEGEEKLKPLSRLNLKELKNHYNHKILLTADDIELANLVWHLYCENNPAKLIPEIKRKSNFEYLSSCIRAHLERFPSMTNGLNVIEMNILKLIKNNTIKSKNQLLGYTLQYQGYYGYGDMQMKRLIKELKIFYTQQKNIFVLTEAGEIALNEKQNFYRELKNDLKYGGANKYDYLYNPETHNLLKL